MTKNDLIGAVRGGTGMPKRDACATVETLLGIIKERLEFGEDVKVTGFGKWEVKQKQERRGRNPQTGEAMTISRRRSIAFRPSNRLKDRLND